MGCFDLLLLSFVVVWCLLLLSMFCSNALTLGREQKKKSGLQKGEKEERKQGWAMMKSMMIAML